MDKKLIQMFSTVAGLATVLGGEAKAVIRSNPVVPAIGISKYASTKLCNEEYGNGCGTGWSVRNQPGLISAFLPVKANRERRVHTLAQADFFFFCFDTDNDNLVDSVSAHMNMKEGLIPEGAEANPAKVYEWHDEWNQSSITQATANMINHLKKGNTAQFKDVENAFGQVWALPCFTQYCGKSQVTACDKNGMWFTCNAVDLDGNVYQAKCELNFSHIDLHNMGNGAELMQCGIQIGMFYNMTRGVIYSVDALRDQFREMTVTRTPNRINVQKSNPYVKNIRELQYTR